MNLQPLLCYFGSHEPTERGGTWYVTVGAWGSRCRNCKVFIKDKSMTAWWLTYTAGHREKETP